MSENGHERPVGSDGSRTQSRKPEPENKKGHVTNFEKSILCNNILSMFISQSSYCHRFNEFINLEHIN